MWIYKDGIYVPQGKSEVNQILTRMIGAEINLVREGFQIGCPNDGYINDVNKNNGRSPKGAGYNNDFLKKVL
jgi:hypothetical protein